MITYILYISSLFNIITLPEKKAADTEIKWYSWEEAQALSKESPKKIFIDLYTDWCGWCKRMDASTFKEAKIVEYLNSNFYPVKFNAEQKESISFNEYNFVFVANGSRGYHQLAYALLDGRMGYPSFVTLDETFARIMISPGFKQPDQLIKELIFAKEEKYKEMSFDDYMKSAD